MDPIEAAKQNHAKGFSCSQAVLLAFAEELGVDKDTAARIAAGFGGGMGRSGRTCGAVSGAVMAIGLVEGATEPSDKAAKEKTYAVARRMLEEFRSQRGALDCNDLIGVDISTPEGYDLARERGLFAGCGANVEASARILSGLLVDLRSSQAQS
jgi:C_GCAxxG_C_C family probable redox protein